MDRNKSNYQFSAVIILSALLIAAVFFPIIVNPCQILLSLGGDASKNYFAYLYHIEYDRGVWFSGMNYPYGEHIIYTDGQPILSAPLSYIKGYLPINVNAALAIMHICIVASYWLAVIYMYKILRRYKTSFLSALIFASLIVLLSPQLLRIFGHYGLSYCCVIPMLFYWSINYFDTNMRKYPVYIFLLGSIISFAHPYFIVIFFVWLFFYCTGYSILYGKTVRQKLSHIVPIIVSAVGILSVFKIILILTDPIKDRPIYPWGTLTFVTDLELLFTSTFSPFWDYMGKHVLMTDIYGGEGYTYPGLIVIAVTACSFIMFTVKWIKKRSIVHYANFPRLWLFIAFGALLVGMGVPFIWHMEWLLDYISVFRQFRSLGRISWIFYYIISVYAAVTIDQWFVQLRRKNKKVAAYIFLLFTIIVWSWEISGYVGHYRAIADNGQKNYNWMFSTNRQSWEQSLNSYGRSAKEFQAILFVPFFHVGTDKLEISSPDGYWLFSKAMQASMQLHLPIIESWMSRASWSQAFKQVRIAAGPFSDKPVLQMVDNRPFLLVRNIEDSLDNDCKYLLQASDFIGNFSGCSLYACYPDRIKANDIKYKNEAKMLAQKMRTDDTCISISGSPSIKSENYIIDHLDKMVSNNKLFGKGAFAPEREQEDYTFSYTFRPQKDTQLYEFSIWALVNDHDFGVPYYTISLFDSTGNTILSTEMFGKQSLDNYGMWLRTSTIIRIPAACRTLKCVYHGKPCPAITLDELVMRPVDALTISRSQSGAIMANNHLLK
jgi:hypothetical protein